MNRPIRIGLIAEGEAELGASIPWIKPQDGGKVIDREKEGALHTLIRRELKSHNFQDCEFVQRHPSTQERKGRRRTGHGILEKRYLQQVVIAWKPEEVDLILIVVDSDDQLAKRQQDLEVALNTIRDNHLDHNDEPILDRSAAGLAIKNFETWLLADTRFVTQLLGIDVQKLDNLEELDNTKDFLETAITNSTYLAEDTSNQRPLRVRWQIAFNVDVAIIQLHCQSYASFIHDLQAAATVTKAMLSKL